MRIRATTVSGSVYVLNREMLTWSRPIVKFTQKCDHGGVLGEWPSHIACGESLVMLVESTVEDLQALKITTSRITRLEYNPGDEPYTPERPKPEHKLPTCVRCGCTRSWCACKHKGGWNVFE